MKETTIYSIGHGNKKIEDLTAELHSFNIAYLLDIRSKPFSKWNPQFNQEALASALEKAGIRYVFAGDALGGLPKDSSCYDRNGKVAYERIKEKDFFKEGLTRLVTANEKRIRLAVMCSESKPEECHRSKLIGEELLKKDISIKHIVSDKVVKPQEAVVNELTKGMGRTDLFGKKEAFYSRKSY